METLKVRKVWSDILQTLKDYRSQPRLQYPVKLPFTNGGETKTSHAKTKLKQYVFTTQPYKGTRKETNLKRLTIPIKIPGINNLRLVNQKRGHIHPTTGKKQKSTMFIDISQHQCSQFPPTKRHRVTAEWMQTQYPSFCCIQETHLNIEDSHNLRVTGQEKIFQVNGPKKQAGVVILISDSIEFKPKPIRRDRVGHSIFNKGKIHQDLWFLTSMHQTQGHPSS